MANEKVKAIILRKKQGVDCSESESAEIKGFIKDNAVSVDHGDVQIVEDIQTHFPIEYGEALDEMEKNPRFGKGGKAGAKKDLPGWDYAAGMEYSPNQILNLFREKAKSKYGRVLLEQEERDLMEEAKEQHEHGLDIDNILEILEIYIGSEPDGGSMGKGGAAVAKKKTLKKGDSIQILGKRWFERTNGNTYHSVDVYVNNEFVGRDDFSYGYGDQYIHSGLIILKEHYNVPKGFDPERSSIYQLEEMGIKILTSISDVSRKKDLEKGGVAGSAWNSFWKSFSEDGALFGGSYFEGDSYGKGGKAGKDKPYVPKAIKKRLEHLRKELRAERISYGELTELQSLAEYIDPSDVELLEPAGVPEFPDDKTYSIRYWETKKEYKRASDFKEWDEKFTSEKEAIKSAQEMYYGRAYYGVEVIDDSDEESVFHLSVEHSSGDSMATGGAVSEAKINKLIKDYNEEMHVGLEGEDLLILDESEVDDFIAWVNREKGIDVKNYYYKSSGGSMATGGGVGASKDGDRHAYYVKAWKTGAMGYKKSKPDYENKKSMNYDEASALQESLEGKYGAVGIFAKKDNREVSISLSKL